MERDFYVYLLEVRCAAISAQCARESIERAEYNLTRLSTASTDGVRVDSGGTHYDVIAMRVQSYQAARAGAGKRLHEAVAALSRFRSELQGCGLGEDEQHILWLRHVEGLRADALAERVGMPLCHAWGMLKDAERVLREYLSGE